MFNKIREAIEVKKAVMGVNLIHVPNKEDILVTGERFVDKLMNKDIGKGNNNFKEIIDCKYENRNKQSLNSEQEDVIFPKRTKYASEVIIKKDLNNEETEHVKDAKSNENKEHKTLHDKEKSVNDNQIKGDEINESIKYNENKDIKNTIDELVDEMIKPSVDDKVIGITEDQVEGDIDLIIELAHKIEDDDLLNEDISTLLGNSIMYDDTVAEEIEEYEDLYYDSHDDYESVIIKEIPEEVFDPTEENVDEIIMIDENLNDDLSVEASHMTKDYVDEKDVLVNDGYMGEETISEEKTMLDLEAIREYIIQEEMEIKKNNKSKKKTYVKSKTHENLESKKNNK